MILVNPRNTSKTCSGPGHCERANRQSQASFVCRSCGLSLNADYNVTLNIAYLAGVNQPMVCSA
jgi:putative transposase